MAGPVHRGTSDDGRGRPQDTPAGPAHRTALASAADAAGVAELFVHGFTDGRDTSPTGGADFLKTCEEELAKSDAQIITVVGRYFAMDRDRRWDRTKKAWDAIVLGRGEICKN